VFPYRRRAEEDDDHPRVSTTISTGRPSFPARACSTPLEIVGKKIDTVKVVFSGAGAAGIACAKFYITLGVRRENLILCDTKGVVYRGRKEGMNPYKSYFAIDTDAGHWRMP